MTNEDIIRMAREADVPIRSNWAEQELLAFANLVAAAERNACEMAVEDIARQYQKAHHPSAENVADECAAVIRARGNT